MLVIDESISELEVWWLRKWRIHVRVVGEDLAAKSISDDNIIPLLHRLKTPRFFTRDRDFWRRSLCHSAYALVYVDVSEEEGLVATHIRRFLRLPVFNSSAKRVGKVVHVHRHGVKFWQHGSQLITSARWQKKS